MRIQPELNKTNIGILGFLLIKLKKFLKIKLTDEEIIDELEYVYCNTNEIKVLGELLLEHESQGSILLNGSKFLHGGNIKQEYIYQELYSELLKYKDLKILFRTPQKRNNILDYEFTNISGVILTEEAPGGGYIDTTFYDNDDFSCHEQIYLYIKRLMNGRK